MCEICFSLQTLKNSNSRLENRTQLVTVCHMGAKVFINCAGFIKIDTSALGDSTEAYIEVLDGSRVHPETYEWARKMAIDALEYDEAADDANPAGALEEILENPDKLSDLDLDAFAAELDRQVGACHSMSMHYYELHFERMVLLRATARSTRRCTTFEPSCTIDIWTCAHPTAVRTLTRSSTC